MRQLQVRILLWEPKGETMLKEKCEDLQFFRDGDYWGFQWIGHCYYLANREDHGLYGDRLPGTLEEARQACRIANLAHEHALEISKKQLAEWVEKKMGR